MITGEIIQGVVKPGMKLTISLNSQLSVQGKVAGVEVICGEGGCKPGIVIECESDEELEAWRSLSVGEGEVLPLSGA